MQRVPVKTKQCRVCGRRIKFSCASSSPSAFSSRPGYTSWAYLMNGRIRGAPREDFSELISMNEVEQFIFEPALKARWYPTELLVVLRAQECKHRYPGLNRPKLAGELFHRKIFRAYRRAMTFRGESGTSTWGGRGKASSSYCRATKTCGNKTSSIEYPIIRNDGPKKLPW